MPAPYQSPPPIDLDLSPTTVLSCVIPGLALVYHLLQSTFHLPSLWELVFIMLPGAVLGPAAKEKLEHAFGQIPGGMVARVRQRAASLVGGGIGGSILGSGEGLVGGLWNIGNTCYQNSVLQAMASLSHLKPHLQAMTPDDVNTASGALTKLLATLNQLSNNPRAQTPSPIIVRGSETSGWTFNEQQDAQEFFQNLTGSLEKEVARVLDRRRDEQMVGLEGILRSEKGDQNRTSPIPLQAKALKSPFEGLLAQRVGCLKCGYVESISLQPFTTLSLSLPSSFSTTLANCLRAFAEIESIPEVDCDKCTLIAVHSRLTGLLTNPNTSDTLRPTIETRIKAVEEALDDDNFTPTIPGIKLDGAHKVSSTKTKHIMIARPPPVLVIHTNRSQFDMITGIVGKNYAAVEFPAVLDLAEVGVVTSHEGLCQDPGRPITAPLERSGEEVLYKLRAVVAHYGAHHNGHYVCYREANGRWFRISDHEVYSCTEEDALRAGNAFMIFYERIEERPQPPSSIVTQLALRDEVQAPPLSPLFNLPLLLDDEQKEAAEIPLPPSRSLSPIQLEIPIQETEMSIVEDLSEEDVPELTNDVSSERDTSPETPPPESPTEEYVGLMKNSGTDITENGATTSSEGGMKQRPRGKRRKNSPQAAMVEVN